MTTPSTTVDLRRHGVALLAVLACAGGLRAHGGEPWPDPGTALLSADPGPPLESPPADPLAVVMPDGVHGPSPRTLAEFVELAERSHPRLIAARAAVEAARGKAVQARLYPNPMLAGGSPQAAGQNSQWFGFASQDVVTAGKLRLAQQAALREVQKAEYDLIRARYDVLRDVRQGFYALLVSQRRVEIFKQLLDISKRSFEIGSQLAAAGEGTKADVLFWSIERDRADVRLINSAILVETGRRELAAAIGLPRADVGTLEADLFQTLPNFDLKQLQAAVVQRNALPRAAEANIARAQWALERAVVEPIPNVNLMGGYQRQVDFPPQNQGLLQVMVEVPLFDRNQGNIRSARADIASSRGPRRPPARHPPSQAAQAVASYRTSQRLVEWYERYILPKARETLELTQKLYAQGEVTFLSLLQAQRTLTETELAYVEAQADRWTGAVTIADLLQLEVFPPLPDAPAAVELLPGMPLPDQPAAVPAPPPAAVPALPQVGAPPAPLPAVPPPAPLPAP